ncbi:alkaline phosphatase D family protein [Xenophilus arseniciresistens]|uniref:Alkaline phosphatase D family protein n=1 Tax=Xenophilus arseniciresistens TaxID=1283306 RepID=A0AAE3SZ05_9BURK|nr:alkaline phosphatase D family protein [Xenophilus arseniciresistens]MDA7416657.1 alkaline phosphatase D family protein [Xenophilus arseniciresistens]
MDRRHFLRWGGFITTSAVLTACGGGGGSPPFLPIVPTPGGSDPGDNNNGGGDPSVPPATGSNWKFPQSVASGDPKAGSILLWTRAVPADAHDVDTVASLTADFSIRLQVTAADNAPALGGSAALAGTLVLDVAVPVQAQWDHTVRHRVTGLEAGRTYYYQFIAGDVRSRVGRFRTAAAADAAVPQLKFAFLSCQDWSINHWGAFSDLATQELDFVVHLGDYIYETVGEAFQTGAVETRHGLLALPDGASKEGAEGSGRYATTLADYRYLYKHYRSDARLQAVHERFAFVAVWDDHEFSDDAWQDAETYSNGSFNASTGGGDNNRQRARRRSANQAWFEFMLADIAFDAETTGIDSVQIYRDLRFGRLAHLVMTDERLYRSDHVVPEAMPNPASGAALGSIGARYMVPQPLISALEAQKIAATRAAQPTGDALANVSMLGTAQRSWWKNTMAASDATWKLWGNEVSLLRMGLDGTQAIGTLVALQSIATLATQIGQTAANTAGDVPLAAGVVAAVVAGASQQVAFLGATAIKTGGVQAGVLAGLTATQAGLAQAAMQAAQAQQQQQGGAAAQATAGAQVIAFGYVKGDVIANKAASPFVIAAGLADALAPYFTKFLINCDQWDGYGAERRELLAHLRDRGVRNVVALTGDIHAFFAGAVHDDFDAEGGGTPVMVDLVTAGVSSDSFFNYLSSAADGLAEGLSTLVYYPLTLPVPGIGDVRVNVNLLDYTLGMPSPTAQDLVEQIRVPLRGALARAGVPEAQLDATHTAVLGALQTDAAFVGQLLPVAQQLAGLRSNPWLALSQTDVQGYALVTLTEAALRCEFRQVNPLVGGQAPTAPLMARSLVATVRNGVPAVTMGTQPQT